MSRGVDAQEYRRLYVKACRNLYVSACICLEVWMSRSVDV